MDTFLIVELLRQLQDNCGIILLTCKPKTVKKFRELQEPRGWGFFISTYYGIERVGIEVISSSHDLWSHHFVYLCMERNTRGGRREASSSDPMCRSTICTIVETQMPPTITETHGCFRFWSSRNLEQAIDLANFHKFPWWIQSVARSQRRERDWILWSHARTREGVGSCIFDIVLKSIKV